MEDKCRRDLEEKYKKMTEKEICKCGEEIGTNKDCSYCKEFIEASALGEFRK